MQAYAVTELSIHSLSFFVFIRFLLNSVKTTVFFKLLFAEALLGRMYP